MNFYIQMREEKLEDTPVLYMRRTGPYGPENAVLMETFKVWLKDHGLDGGSGAIIAVALDDPCVTKAEDCRYDVCLVRDIGGEEDWGGVKSRTLDGGRYVTFLLEHTQEAVQRAWMESFAVLEKHGYVPDISHPMLERYGKQMVEDHRCEFCVPVL